MGRGIRDTTQSAVSRMRGETAWTVSIGSGMCGQCESAIVSRTRPTRWQRFSSWFNHGGPAPDIVRCVNGHEWGESRSMYRQMISRQGWRGTAMAPIDVMQMVLQARTMQPVPRIYALAAVAGSAIGLVTQRVFRVRWWIPAAAFVAGTWAFFASSALRDRERLVDDLGLRIAPAWAHRRMAARVDTEVRAGRALAYGLDGWTGRAIVNAWGGRPVTSVGLTHGESRFEGPWAQTSITKVWFPGPGMFAELGRDLLNVAEDERPPTGDGETRIRWSRERRDRIAAAPLPPWSSIEVDVDGIPMPAGIARTGTWWTMAIPMPVAEDDTPIFDGEADPEPSWWIVVTARDIDPTTVRLVRLWSLAGYLDDH